MCRSHHCSRRHGFFPGVLTIALVIVVLGCVARAGRHDVQSDETRTLPTVGTKRVAVETVDGQVRVRAAAEGVDTIAVHAFIRATGRDQADAEDCLEAIEITCPVAGADEATQEISWAWREPPQPSWRATVSFEVSMPPALDLNVETVNGEIDVVGVTGNCQVKTENGAARLVAATDKLAAETVNGALTIDSPAKDISLRTVNGSIRGSLTNNRGVEGSVATENGEVRLAIAPSAATRVECRTVNGRIKNDLPLEHIEKQGKTRLSGELSGGGDALKVTTTNGGITLSRYRPGHHKDRD